MLIRSDHDEAPPFLLTMPLDSVQGAELQRLAATLCLPPSGVMALAWEHWRATVADQLPALIQSRR